MPTIRHPGDLAVLRARLEAVSPDSVRRWGTMEVRAMLDHLGDGLEQALGRRPMPDQSSFLFRTVVKRIVLRLPMPKGAPTAPAMDSRRQGTSSPGFEAAHSRVLSLLDETAAWPADRPFADHPAFGPMDASQRGILTWKHIDHHLRQFGA